MATSNGGTLLAVYDIRRDNSGDLQGDIDVGLSRSTDGGETWEPMQVIMDMGEWGGRPQRENGIGDPAILIDRNTGTIWRSEEHTSELQSRGHLVCRLLLEKKNKTKHR